MINRLINDILLNALPRFQSDAASNLISWSSVFNYTKNIKQAGDRIFLCPSLCQKLS